MSKRSSIDMLPPGVRSWLEKSLVEGNFRGYQQLEELLREKGFSIGKSSIHRYGSKLESRLATVRASTEAARIIADAVPDESDNRSAAVIAMVQSDLFNAMLSLQEAADTDDTADRVKLLSRAASAIAEVSRASIGQKKFAREIRKAALDDVAKAVDRVAGAGKTMTAEDFKRILRESYGA